MAYMSKENKDSKAPRLRALAKSYGLTATVAVRHSSTLVLNVSKGKIDFIGNYAEVASATKPWASDELRESAYKENKARKYMQVSHHWTDGFDGRAKEFLDKAFTIMNEGNWDKSDIMTDYFNTGWYTDINIGKWDRPYTVIA